MRATPTLWGLGLALALPIAAGGDLDETLARWRVAYVSGRIALDGPAMAERGVRIYARGLLGSDRAASMSNERALRYLLEQSVLEPTEDVVREVLRLAAVGLWGDPLPVSQMPHRVRKLATAALARVRAGKTLFLLARIASGESEVRPRRWHPGLQAAALRVLGQGGSLAMRPRIERQLDHQGAVVRLAAAEALGELCQPESLPALWAALRRETNPEVAQQVVAATGAILRAWHTDLSRKTVHQTVAALSDHLEHADWRSAILVVDLLEVFRRAAAVPALIRLLERFAEHPGQVRRGVLSGTLRYRTGEVLQSLTGCILPADPERWREFWTRYGAEFELAAPPTGQRSGTSAAGFFGIPIHGNRIVFVIDTSGRSP